MLEDSLERADIEHTILHGEIEKMMTEDIRGTRYRIEGPARDGRRTFIVCRFKEIWKSCHHYCICCSGGGMTCEFCGGETSPGKKSDSIGLRGSSISSRMLTQKSVLSVESGISTQRFLMTLIVFWRPTML